MPISKTNEQALESAIEKSLTGSCREEINDDNSSLHEDGLPYGDKFYMGSSNDFNANFAIDEVRFWSFLNSTQKEELDKLKRNDNWKRVILERFDRLVKLHGLLSLLKKGLDVDDAHFVLMYPAPLASSSVSVKDNFKKNQFSITRQIRYSVDRPTDEIDMLIFINGLPIATIELKNHWTGQNARVHGIHQYKFDRDPRQPLLNFGRCLVHFAVDTDEVYMTTKLCGKSTFFLPFNKGNNHGKGNPVNPNGHKSAYLWEEVFTPESLANIIQHFVLLDGKFNEPLSKKTLFFPRYHQLDVVRRLIKHTSENGVGNTYLIQHSAGSGKSNSITWAAYQLIEVYPKSKDVHGAKSVNSPLFDSVIVVTDRRLLDKQLRENIKSFTEVKNIVAPATTSKELAEALEQGKKIIITTIQKFPFIVDGIADLRHKRFAVIIDEAHSSQSGSAADNMNRAMGQQVNEDEDKDKDAQDKILEIMRTRKMRGNASYFAFTATPKSATLEKFGDLQADGSFEPFHLYSMKQAIEEGFILDVLANYTTYKSYYEIQKSMQKSLDENPLFDTAKAQSKLRTYVERHDSTIATKSELILDHFIDKIYKTKKLKGKAKAMVVCQNIVTAIKYYLSLKKILNQRGVSFKIAIAFSGTKTVGGIEYTEASMNGFAEKDTSLKFDTDDYKILVVANKYLTGFDQQKLSAMYVDKKLQGVVAVQALSRLNRSCSKLGKKTEDLFVLDFFNTVEDIKTSFDPFYTATSLSEATDVNVLHELKASLDDTGVYEWHEVEDFVSKYFSGVDAQELSPIIDFAAQRFNADLELENAQKADIKIKAKHFVKIYGQMAAIMSFEMIKWEKLFWFLKFLIPKLIVKSEEDALIDEILDSVDLSTYGLERVKLNESIALDDSESELEPQNSNPRGAHGSTGEKETIEEIIKAFNERWFHSWDATPEAQRIKLVSIRDGVVNHADFKDKYAENTDTENRDLALRKIFNDVLIHQRKVDMDLYKNCATDDSFKAAFFDTIVRMLASNV